MRATARKGSALPLAMTLSPRAFAESPAYCGLSLSPVVGAVMDAVHGLPVTLSDDDSLSVFGCRASEIPRRRFRQLTIRGGARGGKSSRLCAVLALHAAVTVPLALARGESAVAAIVAPDLGLARQDLAYVNGYVDGSPVLSGMVRARTSDYVELRRPDGYTVRVQVFAASRGGRSVRGRSLVCAVLDEACFFLDTDSGVVNDRDIVRAVAPRIVNGGLLVLASTPWLEGTGELEASYARDFGTHDSALVATATTMQLRPDWDADGSIRKQLEADDPESYSREILATPISGGAGMFFDGAAIAASVDKSRAQVVPWTSGHRYFAACDPAFKSDSFALVIVELVGKRLEVVRIEEWRPAKGAPLRPSEVIERCAEVLREYRIGEIATDGHYIETVREHFYRSNIRIVQAPTGAQGVSDTFVAAKNAMREGRVAIPDNPRLVTQLRAVVERPTAGGGVSITQPRRRGGGHGDIVSAFTLAVWLAALRQRGSGITVFSRPPGDNPYRHYSQ